jgi:siroheme synthase
LVQSGTLPVQKTAVGTVASIVELSERGGFGSPSVIIVGEMVNFAEKLDCLRALVRVENSIP